MIEKFVDLTKNNNFISKIYFEYPSMEMKIKGTQREITASIFRFIRNGMDMGLVRDDLAPEFIFDLIEGAAMHYFRMGLTGSAFEKSLHPTVLPAHLLKDAPGLCTCPLIVKS